MSDTPRTDTAEFNYATSGGGWGKPFGFARDLERILNRQGDSIKRLSEQRYAQDMTLSDIGQIVGDETLPSAEIVKRVNALAEFAKDFTLWVNTHPNESQPWSVKMNQLIKSVSFVKPVCAVCGGTLKVWNMPDECEVTCKVCSDLTASQPPK
jgi:hypothetical protein